MAEKLFKLEIVTPQKVAYSDEVESFSAPGVMGGFQVLYNHAPMLSVIGVGRVKLKDGKGTELQFATSGGFVEVNKNQVVLLAESIERPEDIDRNRAEAAKERASKRLSERLPATDLDRARLALARAMNRLKLASRV